MMSTMFKFIHTDVLYACCVHIYVLPGARAPPLVAENMDYVPWKMGWSVWMLLVICEPRLREYLYECNIKYQSSYSDTIYLKLT